MDVVVYEIVVKMRGSIINTAYVHSSTGAAAEAIAQVEKGHKSHSVPVLGEGGHVHHYERWTGLSFEARQVDRDPSL